MRRNLSASPVSRDFLGEGPREALLLTRLPGLAPKLALCRVEAERARAAGEPAGGGLVFSGHNPVCATSKSGTDPLRHYTQMPRLHTSCFSDNRAFKYNSATQ